MEKCSAYINQSCKNGYPDDVTSRCGICYGRDHKYYWTPCMSERFHEINYPKTGHPMKEYLTETE